MLLSDEPYDRCSASHFSHRTITTGLSLPYSFSSVVSSTVQLTLLIHHVLSKVASQSLLTPFHVTSADTLVKREPNALQYFFRQADMG